MKHVQYVLLAAASLALMAGCGWEGNNGDEFSAWNDSYNWVNFSGMYRDSGNGVLVAGHENVPPTPATETAKTTNIGVGISGLHVYSGTLPSTPIVPGSVTIDCQGFHFSDNGSGVLTGSIAGTSGSVNYTTGSWSLNLGGLEFTQNAAITANWRASEGGTSGQVVPGSTGAPPVYSFSVAQTGNLLTFTDSNGKVYQGYISGISSPTSGGNPPSTAAGQGQNIQPNGTVTAEAPSVQSGSAIAQFEVEGTSISGAHVKITGVLSLDFVISTTVVTTPGFFGNTSQSTSTESHNRTMRATWIEDNGQTGDILGTAAG